MIPQHSFSFWKKAPQKWHIPSQYVWKLINFPELYCDKFSKLKILSPSNPPWEVWHIWYWKAFCSRVLKRPSTQWASSKKNQETKNFTHFCATFYSKSLNRRKWSEWLLMMPILSIFLYILTYIFMFFIDVEDGGIKQLSWRTSILFLGHPETWI